MVFRHRGWAGRLFAAGWLALAVVAAGGAYLTFRPRPAVAPSAPAAPVAQRSVAPESLGVSEAELRAVWQGLERQRPAPPPVVVAAPKPVVLGPSFKVRGIVYSTAGASVAFIQSGKSVLLYRVGDEVEGWRVTAIDMQSVALARGAESLTVALHALPYGDRSAVAGAKPPKATALSAAPARVAAAPAAPSRGAVEGGAPVRPVERGVALSAPPRGGDATVRVAADVAAQARANPTSLLEGVLIEPLVAEGKMSGLTLRSVRAGSLAARYGLWPGDQIVAVNGQTLTSPDRVMSLYRRHANNDSVRITLVRNGERKDVIYYVQ